MGSHLMGFSYKTWAESWGNSWGFSWGGGITPPTPSIGGGGGGPTLKDYEHYAKRLRKLAKAADRYNEKKYVKDVTEAANIIKNIEVAEPILLEIAKSYELPDTTGIANSIRQKIELMLKQLELLMAQERQREAEEEMVMLLCISTLL